MTDSVTIIDYWSVPENREKLQWISNLHHKRIFRPVLILLRLDKIIFQSGILFIANILSIILTLVSGVMNTRLLGPLEYGIYTFIIALVTFLSTFFTLGIGASGARVVAKAKTKKEEGEIFAACLIFGIFIFIIFTLVIILSKYIIVILFNESIKAIYISSLILCGTIPFEIILLRICRGGNKIKYIFILTILPKTIYILLFYSYYLLNNKINSNIAICIYFISIFITCLYVYIKLRPNLNNFKKNILILYKEIKSYGLNIYLGSIADTTTYRLDKIFIAYFVNTTYVGYYNIATTIVSPMILFSTSLAAASFKDFTIKCDKIEKNIIFYNFIWLSGSLIFLLIFSEYIIIVLFTDKYITAYRLILPLGVAGFFQGMYQPYNMFLNAKGRGKELRSIAWVNASINIIGNLYLIQVYGAYGAALSSMISKMSEFIMNLYYYNKCIKEIRPLYRK